MRSQPAYSLQTILRVNGRKCAVVSTIFAKLKCAGGNSSRGGRISLNHLRRRSIAAPINA